MLHARRPVATNGALAAALVALQAVQLYVIPAVLLPRSTWWGLLLVALVPPGLTLLAPAALTLLFGVFPQLVFGLTTAAAVPR